MKDLKLTTPYRLATFDELDESDRRLVQLAREATFRSYAPYSKFRVGAAILLDNGETVTGANQENVAYPSGTCAERTACYYAHATYPDARFKAIAIAARDTDGNFVATPTAPCGACRQALLEYEMLAGGDVRVILAGADEIYILPSVKSTLPFAFTEFS
ncbi:MAG: cytidine deaminase [Paramuribaculum sp.]